jgi:hypothetical protein
MADIKRQPKLIKFPVELIKQIERYQLKNNISSFSAAVYELVRIGLETKKN